MKVILQQDVKGKGKKGQLVDVSDGYARNFLLPKKMAIPATADNINTMKQQENARKAQIEREKKEASALAEKLGEYTVKINARAGSGGKLFGSVTSREISDALKEQYGIELEKNKIIQAEPIKAFGTYEVKCRLGYEITGTFKVSVTEQ